jgi:ferritin-like metal-binding protein YciE
MEANNLHELFVMLLKDVYDAENQLVEALPKLADAATDTKLKQGFQMHLDQTQEHVARLEQIAESLNITLSGKTCKGMQGLIEEGEEIMSRGSAPELLDAELIAAGQKAEHYEIATYGTLVEWGKLMKHNDAVDLLEKTLQEEKETDDKLTEMAKTVNKAAYEFASED